MKSVYILIIALFTAGSALAYEGEPYVTPDSWSKHVTANGVQASSKGITLGGANLKIGLTTRAKIRFSEETDSNIYQYARARASDIALGSGHVNINLNVRGAWDSERSLSPNEYHVYYDAMDQSRGSNDLDFRIYQANVEFADVVKGTNLQLGRLYLSTFEGYKIDGGNIEYAPCDFFKINAFYGLPVSYYSNLNTQVMGGGIDIPIEASGTRVRAEYSYFMHNDGGDLNTSVVKARLDQNIFFTRLYGEGALVGNAWTYEAGIDGNVDASRTGFSGYIMGQYDKNKNEINPYVSMYESELGVESEYFMGGLQLTQGITDYVMLGLGFEGRFNFDESYSDRDYYRFFGTLDIIGVLHKENFLSLIADYYTVDSYERQDKNSKMLFGARMTQRVGDYVDLWAGVNVMNYQYKNNPIKFYQDEVGFALHDESEQDENTTLAYIGGMWKPIDWFVLQLDYTFEYSDIFKKYGTDENMHMVEVWANFIW